MEADPVISLLPCDEFREQFFPRGKLWDHGASAFAASSYDQITHREGLLDEVELVLGFEALPVEGMNDLPLDEQVSVLYSDNPFEEEDRGPQAGISEALLRIERNLREKQLESERVEHERREKQEAKQRLHREDIEKQEAEQRLRRENWEKQEAERLGREKAEQEEWKIQEAQRWESEKIEWQKWERQEAERLEREKTARKKREDQDAERLEREKAERKKREDQEVEREKRGIQQAERLEGERLEREKRKEEDAKRLEREETQREDRRKLEESEKKSIQMKDRERRAEILQDLINLRRARQEQELVAGKCVIVGVRPSKIKKKKRPLTRELETLKFVKPGWKIWWLPNHGQTPLKRTNKKPQFYSNISYEK